MRHSRAVLTTVLALGLAALGCEDTVTDPSTGLETSFGNADRAGPNVVHVAADDHEFVTSHQEIASGWTTFRFENQSHAPHFLIIEKMPEFEGDQKTVEDSEAEVVPVFQNFMDSFRSEPLSFPSMGFALPAWYADVIFMGGPGLTSPGETSETRVHLEPGTYVIECYVKTDDGTFHSTKGMIEGLVVGERSNAAGEPPRTSGRLTVSFSDGISIDRAPRRPGTQTFEVHFADQTVYSHFLGHDVHLVRLETGADTEALETWMNWVIPGSLASPGPAGVTFLGGVQDMPAGSTAYLRATLTPGDYAWIAEVPDASGKNMLATFSIP
jgi:hypothetical protein